MSTQAQQSQTHQPSNNTTQKVSQKEQISLNILNPKTLQLQNHFSSTYEHEKILQYEARNYQIQYQTQQIKITKEEIQKEFQYKQAENNNNNINNINKINFSKSADNNNVNNNIVNINNDNSNSINNVSSNNNSPNPNPTQQQPQPRSPPSKQVYLKYGSLIQNQPIFLRQLFFKHYMPHLPQPMKKQLLNNLVIGGTFQTLWWGSLIFTIYRVIKNKNIQKTFKQRITNGFGIAFFFITSTIGFHTNYYIPQIKKIMFKNIQTVDQVMQRHIQILKKHGVDLDIKQNINTDNHTNTQNQSIINKDLSKVKKQTQLEQNRIREKR